MKKERRNTVKRKKRMMNGSEWPQKWRLEAHPQVKFELAEKEQEEEAQQREEREEQRKPEDKQPRKEGQHSEAKEEILRLMRDWLSEQSPILRLADRVEEK